MKSKLIRTLLLLYPARWRNEYVAELEDLLLAGPLRFSVFANVLWSALRQQRRVSNHPAGLIRVLTLSAAACSVAFLFGAICAPSLCVLISLPLAEAFGSPGRPPALIQNQPWRKPLRSSGSASRLW